MYSKKQNRYKKTVLKSDKKKSKKKGNSLGEVYKKIFLMGKIAGIKQERSGNS